MSSSGITGSNAQSDNWTSVYTFVLGLIGGGFLAIGIGEVDMAEGLRGDLMRVYLALITAILAFGGALFVSRLADRISDRRATKRRVYAAVRRLLALSSELETLASDLDEALDVEFGDQISVHRIGQQFQTIATLVADRPNFDELVENDADHACADGAIEAFRYATEIASNIGRFERAVGTLAWRPMVEMTSERATNLKRLLDTAAEHFSSKPSRY